MCKNFASFVNCRMETIKHVYMQILKTVFPKISYLKGFSKKDGEKLCTEPCSDRTRGFKLRVDLYYILGRNSSLKGW